MKVKEIYERAMAGEKPKFPWLENKETCQIECFDENGDFIGGFNTLQEASEMTGINICSISKNLNGLTQYASIKRKIVFKKKSDD